MITHEISPSPSTCTNLIDWALLWKNTRTLPVLFWCWFSPHGCWHTHAKVVLRGESFMQKKIGPHPQLAFPALGRSTGNSQDLGARLPKCWNRKGVQVIGSGNESFYLSFITPSECLAGWYETGGRGGWEWEFIIWSGREMKEDQREHC